MYRFAGVQAFQQRELFRMRGDQVGHRFLSHQPADEDNHRGVGRPAELLANRRAVELGDRLVGHPRIDHRELILGDARFPIKVDHRV